MVYIILEGKIKPFEQLGPSASSWSKYSAVYLWLVVMHIGLEAVHAGSKSCLHCFVVSSLTLAGTVCLTWQLSFYVLYAAADSSCWTSHQAKSKMSTAFAKGSYTMVYVTLKVTTVNKYENTYHYSIPASLMISVKITDSSPVWLHYTDIDTVKKP